MMRRRKNSVRLNNPCRTEDHGGLVPSNPAHPGLSTMGSVPVAAMLTSVRGDRMTALTPDQVTALTTGEVAVLTTAEVVALGTGIGLFTVTQTAAMRPFQVAVLTTDQIVALTNDSIAGLSAADLAALGSAQVASLMTVNPQLNAAQVAGFRSPPVSSGWARTRPGSSVSSGRRKSPPLPPARSPP